MAGAGGVESGVLKVKVYLDEDPSEDDPSVLMNGPFVALGGDDELFGKAYARDERLAVDSGTDFFGPGIFNVG